MRWKLPYKRATIHGIMPLDMDGLKADQSVWISGA